MANAYSLDDLLDFLDHAGDHGLIPAATAQALAVATRNVLGVLSDSEKTDLSEQDIDAVIKRFNNKRAKDFNPSSLKEYGRRLHRAVDLFLAWREDPANFTVKTRATAGPRKRDKGKASGQQTDGDVEQLEQPPSQPGTYHSAIPVRAGVVVTVANVPYDLTKAEAERLAGFVRMLAIEP
jgi:hypothetical protein